MFRALRTEAVVIKLKWRKASIVTSADMSPPLFASVHKTWFFTYSLHEVCCIESQVLVTTFSVNWLKLLSRWHDGWSARKFWHLSSLSFSRVIYSWELKTYRPTSQWGISTIWNLRLTLSVWRINPFWTIPTRRGVLWMHSRQGSLNGVDIDIVRDECFFYCFYLLRHHFVIPCYGFLHILLIESQATCILISGGAYHVFYFAHVEVQVAPRQRTTQQCSFCFNRLWFYWLTGQETGLNTC